MLQLRKAELTDAAVLGVMNEQLIHDERHTNPQRGDQLVQRMRDWLSADYEAAIGTVQDSPALYALWRHQPDGDIFLRQFFVASEFRRQGLGIAAMNQLLDQYWPAGHAVHLEVLTHNHTGQRFWRSVGFAEYSIQMRHPGRES